MDNKFIVEGESGRWKVKVEGGWKVVFMSPSTMKTLEIKAFINMVEGVEGKKP